MGDAARQLRRAPPRPAPRPPRRGALPSLGDVVPLPGQAAAGGAAPGDYVSQAPLLLGRRAGCQSGRVSGGSDPGIPPAPPPSSAPANNKCRRAEERGGKCHAGAP